MISVIVPVYNGETTIEACLRSILGQSGAIEEILVIDDGSFDRTSAICRQLAREDNRLRLLHQPNRGVSAARNYGLREAKEEYVLFVDADDLLPPGAAEMMAQAAGNGADFVAGAREFFRGRWHRKTVLPDENALFTAVCGHLYRRSLIEQNHLRFCEGLPYGEDTVFHLAFGKQMQHPVLLTQNVYCYRLGGAASSCRYYPDRVSIALVLLEAYREYAVHTGRLSAEDLQRIVQREVLETAAHFLLHCGRKRACAEADALMTALRTSMPEIAALGNGAAVVRILLRRQGLRLLLRKGKQIFHQAKRRIHHENRNCDHL